MKWPPKRGGALLQAPAPKRLLLSQANSGHTFAQPCGRGIIWKRWEREARRLFAQYWKTGNAKHLGAFAWHIHGMRMRESRGR